MDQERKRRCRRGSTTFGGHDVLRRCHREPTVPGVSGQGGAVTVVAQEAARSVPRDDPDGVDGDPVARTLGVGGEAQARDASEVVPGAVHGDPQAVRLGGPGEEDVGRPFGVGRREGAGRDGGSLLDVLGVEGFPDDR